MRLFSALISGTNAKNFPETSSPSPPASPSELPPARKSEGEANSPPHFLVMSLDTFEQQGALLELAVPWLEKTLWFIPTGCDVMALAKEGVSRGRIWTAKELLDFLAIPGLTKERVAKVAQAKAIFEGTVLE